MSQQATIHIVRYWDVNGVPVPEEMQFIYDPLDGRSEPIPDDVWKANFPTVQAAVAAGNLASLDGRPIDVLENLWCPMWRSVAVWGDAVRYDGEDVLWDPAAQSALSGWDWLRLPTRPEVRQLTFKAYTALQKSVNEAAAEGVRVSFERMAKHHNEKRELLVANLGEQVADVLVGPTTTGPELMYAARGDI